MTDLWLHGQVLADEAASAAAVRAEGVSAVVAAGSAEQAERLRSLGLRPWACIGAFSVGPDETDLQCQTADGTPRVWFGSGCPSNRALRERLRQRVREMSSWPVDGILLDGIRFASPYEGAATFFTCTCPWCRAGATDRGFSFGRIRAALQGAAAALAGLAAPRLRAAAAGLDGPADLLPPLLAELGLSEWLAFRAALIVDVVREVRRELNQAAPRVRLGAYLFTPSLAPLVGQDYARLQPLLDVVSPMIYRLGDGPACLPAEVLALSRFCPQVEGEEALRLVERFLGLPPSARSAADEMDVTAIARECSRARARLGRGAVLVPILSLDDPGIREATAAATAGHPNGISFFPTGEQQPLRLGQAAAYLRTYDAARRLE